MHCIRLVAFLIPCASVIQARIEALNSSICAILVWQ
jgi:hypothetical protein